VAWDRHQALPIASLVDEDGPQPGAKAFARVVMELGQLLHQDGEDVLHEVRCVRVGESKAATCPVLQQWRVQANEILPCLRVACVAELFEQASWRAGHRERGLFRWEGYPLS
jgi:hypothetical protein